MFLLYSKPYIIARFKIAYHNNLCDVGMEQHIICSEFLETTGVVSLWFVYSMSFPTGETGGYCVMAFTAEIQVLPPLNALRSSLCKKILAVVSKVVC